MLPPALCSAMADWVRGCTQALPSRGDELLSLTRRSTADNYLHAHSINVAILSLRLGLAFRLDEERMLALGLAALLHDIGMTLWLGLAGQCRRLTDSERRRVRLRVDESARVAARLEPFEDRLRGWIGAILLEAGRGRPTRRAGPAVESGQILGLCDCYEAMSHPRSWRKPLLAHQAVKAAALLPQFDAGVRKMLLRTLGVFPPGSFVRIADGEVGVVVHPNPKQITRPIVTLLVDAQGAGEPPRLLDLAKEIVSEVAAVDETELALRDRRLLAAFRAERWFLD